VTDSNVKSALAENSILQQQDACCTVARKHADRPDMMLQTKFKSAFEQVHWPDRYTINHSEVNSESQPELHVVKNVAERAYSSGHINMPNH